MPRWIIAGIVLICLPAQARSHHHRRGGRSFDYYLLSLSWSPTFCRSAGDRGGDECRTDQPRGFVVHGLWPQNDDGGFPRYCNGPRDVPLDLVQELLPIMPSQGLIAHEWQAHGRCSGLGVRPYFHDLREAYDLLIIPEVLRAPRRPLHTTVAKAKAMFAEADPELPSAAIVLECRGHLVSEVRICLDKGFAYRACGEGVRDTCQGAVTFPAAR